MVIDGLTDVYRQDKEEIEYAFGEYIDRCLLEMMVESMAKMYEDEEREIHLREQTDKKRRVTNHKMRSLF